MVNSFHNYQQSFSLQILYFLPFRILNKQIFVKLSKIKLIGFLCKVKKINSQISQTFFGKLVRDTKCAP